MIYYKAKYYKKITKHINHILSFHQPTLFHQGKDYKRKNHQVNTIPTDKADNLDYQTKKYRPDTRYKKCWSRMTNNRQDNGNMMQIQSKSTFLNDMGYNRTSRSRVRIQRDKNDMKKMLG